jgi:site-specific DNA-methyltransferase (adenine-specific)
MKNRIYFGDNLPILRSLADESVDLIYIDPPFNTGKTQKHTRIKTVKSKNGSRKGFQGNTYETIEVGTKAYQDSFDFLDPDSVHPDLEKTYQTLAPERSLYYLETFLRPRLKEAYRLLKPHGSLYFHIDYREVHYCKILLDEIFGRESFLNEIIWAYDYGGRARSKWPAKHDNILFYVKNPKSYIFNVGEIDREPYMAPGLVGPEKAETGKLPTDVWWPGYVGAKITKITKKSSIRGQQATWWQTIVPTNSKERMGYPTQKPRKLLDRIITASSMKGGIVLDFFAGSGTVGESCLELGRNFVLIDNNKAAMEVMAQRFAGIKEIEWKNFDPQSYQLDKPTYIPKQKIEIPSINKDFIMLAATASYLQEELEDENDPWENSPFEWILKLPPRKKGKLGGKLIASWLAGKGIQLEQTRDASETLRINGLQFAIKFSTIWANGIYKFQQIRAKGYDYVICLGISPFDAHCWVFERKFAIEHAKPQHFQGTKVVDYWMEINPHEAKDESRDCGGTLDQAYRILKKLKKK